MSNVYEFRRTPGKGAIWLALIGFVIVLVAFVYYGAEQLVWLVWVAGTVTVAWMLLPRPVAGIRVDADYLVLSAWHNPRPIPLDDIAHLRADDSGFELEVWIVYRNGDEEPIFSGDLPNIDTLIAVMAAHGIPVRDVG